jgi:Spy/CpxP family protein refolding chaperone
MWNKFQKPLLVLSLSLNLAFIAIWLMHTVPGSVTAQKESPDAIENAEVSSSLHRELGVTPDQWTRIEPHILGFRQSAREQRQTIGTLRGQLIDLLADDKVNISAIRAKQEEILAGQRRMQNLVIDLLLQEKGVLTPEQQRALLKLIHQQCKCGEESNSSGPGFKDTLINDSQSCTSPGQ